MTIMAMLFNEQDKAILVGAGSTVDLALTDLLQRSGAKKITKQQWDLVRTERKLQLGKNRIEVEGIA